LAPTAKIEINGRNFYYTWIQLTLYNNWQQFGSKRRQKIFPKTPRTPPFYIIFTSKNHLNAHSSVIKPHMAMNFAPLDSPCQGASSESKKMYLNFFILEKITKNQKNPYFWLPQQKLISMVGTFTIPEFNWPYTITDSNLVRIDDIFRKTPREKSFKRIAPLLSNIWQWILHRWIALVKALLLSRKKCTWIFSFWRKSQKNHHIFGSHSWFQWSFYYTWIQLTLYNNWQQ
jgi:hypothetical protein